MTRRLFTIVAVIIVLAGLGIAVYFIFFAPNSPRLTVGNPSFGTSSGSRNTNSGGTANVVGEAGTVVAPGLIEITNQPVAAGVAVFDTMTGATTTGTSTASSTIGTPDIAVNYIDRASGNVYQYLAVARTLTRINDKTLPGIQEASWLPDGSMAFVRFLSNTNGAEHIETYALPSVEGSDGYFLQEDLDAAQVIGSSTLFTLAVGTDSSVGTAANADGTDPETLFNSALTSMDIFGPLNDMVATTKAANSLDGYTFAIGAGGTFTPILGPLRGLTTLPSPSGDFILYSYTDGSTLYMNVYDRSTGGVINLPLATLAEKCAWTADSSALYCAVPTSLPGTLPDDWYQGAVSFSDRIWRIDLTSRVASLVLDPTTTASTTIDAVNLALDPYSHVLVFRNKKDGSLWIDTNL